MMFQETSFSIANHRKLAKIGQGSFGGVYKCRDIESNSTLAAKWIPFGNKSNGLPSLILREISVLKELDHANVVRLFDVMDTPTGFCLVFEYLDYDLGRLIKDDFNPIDPRLIKVTTLAYKAPELLLRTPYTAAVDIWSVGCIFAEMVNRKPLFGGSIDIMTNIIRTLGVPSERDWPGVTSTCLRVCKKEMLPSEPIPALVNIVPALEPEGLDLLSKMLCMVPS